MSNALPLKSALFIPLASVVIFLAIFYYYYQALDIGVLKLDLTPAKEVPNNSLEKLKYDNTLSSNAQAMTRIHWGISCIALVSSCVISLVVSVYTICMTTCSANRRKRIQIYGVMLIFSIIIGYAGNQFDLSGGVGHGLYENVKCSTNLNTETSIDITTGIIAFTSLLIAFACSSLCIKPESHDFDNQKRLINLFNLNSITTAIALSIGIIQIFFLYKFHTSYINNEIEREILLSGMTFSVAIFYTIFFSLLYTPVLYILRKRSLQLILQSSDKKSKTSATEALNEHGINFSLKKMFQYASLFISPILVGLATKIMEFVLNS